MEMTKWFDTNYHFIVPEFAPDQPFRLSSTHPLEAFQSARALGITTRPVLLGPVSFLLLGKPTVPNFAPLTLLERLLPVYAELLQQLAAAGATWVQFDEPCLGLDLPAAAPAAYQQAYQVLAAAAPSLQLLLATYFGDLRENLPLALRLPVAAVHLDLVRAPQQLAPALELIPPTMALSLGVVDGRNIWKTDLHHAFGLVQQASAALGSERVLIGPSCSLVHVPYDLDQETELEPEISDWLAFAKQKLDEIVLLTRAANEGVQAVAEAFAANADSLARRRTSPRIHNPAVQARIAAIEPTWYQRTSPFAVRRQRQQEVLQLPLFPTTTIGSFPQTDDIRRARAQCKAG